MPMYGVELWVQLTTTHIYNNPEHLESPTDDHRRNYLVVALQMAKAVGYLQENFWAHLDLKPENFVVNPQGKVTLIDFGMARFYPPYGRQYTTQADGTAAYLAPEVYTAVANRQPDSLKLAMGREIWALAICFFAMACGQSPWSCAVKHDDKFKDYAKSVYNKTFSGFYELRLQHWTIQEMLHRMLALDPSKRATITECIDCLNAARTALLQDMAVEAQKARTANIRALLHCVGQAAANDATQSDDTDSDDNTRPAKKPREAQK